MYGEYLVNMCKCEWVGIGVLCVYDWVFDCENRGISKVNENVELVTDNRQVTHTLTSTGNTRTLTWTHSHAHTQFNTFKSRIIKNWIFNRENVYAPICCFFLSYFLLLKILKPVKLAGNVMTITKRWRTGRYIKLLFAVAVFSCCFFLLM